MRFGFGRAVSKTLKAQKRLTKLIKVALKPSRKRPKTSRSKAVQVKTVLSETTAFGSNPARLLMKSFAPARLQLRPALVVVLHGCRQTPQTLDAGTGFSKLAKDRGFVLLYPEQRRANNSQGCFNWFRPSAVARDRGEVMSIKQMIEHCCKQHRVDRSKVFVVGLSAGGAMAGALAANYPDMFAGAAIIAGMPFGSARDAMSALRAMKNGATTPAGGWERPIIEINAGSCSWPPITIWHGEDDRIVNPVNAQACVAQWLQAKGIAKTSGRLEEKPWGTLTSWTVARVQTLALYSVRNLGHGFPVKQASNPRQRPADPYVISTGISAPAELMRLWRLARL